MANLDSIASLLSNSTLDDKAKEKAEEKEETKEDEKPLESDVKETAPPKPAQIECEDKDYKDQISDDYKRECNNKMGNNVWKKEKPVNVMLTWNRF